MNSTRIHVILDVSNVEMLIRQIVIKMSKRSTTENPHPPNRRATRGGGGGAYA